MVNLLSPVLVLNTGMVPIDVANVKEAVTMQYLDKVMPVKVDEKQEIRSPSIVYKLPRVIMLLGFNKIPKRKVVFSRLNVIYRDDMCCCYCGKQLPINKLTVDHVIPVSRWKSIPEHGKPAHVHGWENQVSACEECNRKKGHKLLKECGFSLIKKPFEPKYMPFLVIARDKAERFGWIEFLNYNARIVECIKK